MAQFRLIDVWVVALGGDLWFRRGEVEWAFIWGWVAWWGGLGVRSGVGREDFRGIGWRRRSGMLCWVTLKISALEGKVGLNRGT